MMSTTAHLFATAGSDIKYISRIPYLESHIAIKLRGGALTHRKKSAKYKPTRGNSGVQQRIRHYRDIATRAFYKNPVTATELAFVCTVLHFVTFMALNLIGRAFNLLDAIYFCNGVVFLAWQIAKRIGGLQNWMTKHFTLNYDFQARTTRPTSILLSGFSHMDKIHLASNMACLRAFGPDASRTLGSHGFMHLYIGGLVSSSLVSCLWPTVSSHFGVQEDQNGCSLGASGAISAVVTFVCLAHWDKKVLIETPDWLKLLTSRNQLQVKLGVAGVLWALMDVFGLFHLNVHFSEDGEGKAKINYAAHIGGAVFGLIFYCSQTLVQRMGRNALFAGALALQMKFVAFAIGCVASVVLVIFPDALLQNELQKRSVRRHHQQKKKHRLR
jgi:membrane associated rhomboid family serine protease